MRAMQVASGLAFCLLWTITAVAQPAPVDPGAVANVIKTLQAPSASEAPVVYQSPSGFVRFLGAPPEGYFETPISGQKSASPETSAESFLKSNAGAFTRAPADGFKRERVNEHGGSSYVRFGQQYKGVPVYGAAAVVQTDASGRVFNVMSDVMRNSETLDNGTLSLTPSLSADALEIKAKTETAARYDDVAPSHLNRANPPVLEIYDPAVVGETGPTRLVWRFGFTAIVPRILREVAILDAHTGEVVSLYTEITNALSRDVRDSANSGLFPNNSARLEGDPPTGIKDVDDAYDFHGDTYNFYFSEHDYDSFDGAGSTMLTAVRFPFANAFWQGTFSVFGTGWAADDVVAHEITHGVTQFTSGLIYQGFSGAINESLSDMWGEFVDLTNGAGDDRELARWFVGEDISVESDGSEKGTQGLKQLDLENQIRLQKRKQSDVEIPGNSIRSMKDPTLFGHPDRLGSPLLINPSSAFDNGGVHINSGIGNKLCYLLVDGDSFNGQTIRGQGISRTADLFFATQFLLTPASDYNDLYVAMNAATVDQGYSFADRLNVAAAGRAVEIEPVALANTGLRAFRATPTRDLSGNAVIALTWQNPETSDFRDVVVVRNLGGFAATPSDGLQIYRGADEKFLDVNVLEGTTYYYTLIANLTENFPQVGFARATAGAAPAPVLSEGFSTIGAQVNPLDLSFTQLTFVPVGPPVGDLGAAIPGTSYDSYALTATQTYAFPVAQDDVNGGSFRIPLTDDGIFTYNLGTITFPFFGENYSQLFISSNGYISFSPTSASNVLNFPTLESHFQIPRISYLFTDLAAGSGGEMWIRNLDDRVAITIENIPEFPRRFDDLGSAPNNVQVELFANGQIRFTYGALNAEVAFVGISDGRGVPPVLSELFPNVLDVPQSTDLSAAPVEPTELYTLPVPTAEASGGETLSFTIQAIGAIGNDAPIQMFGEWNGPGAVPFAQTGDDTGRFNWQVPVNASGVFTFRVTVVQGTDRAFQIVRLYIGATIQPPTARNLALSSGTAFEDPAVSRTVDTYRPLMADYDYFHPSGNTDPVSFGEGDTILWWYRNGEIVPAYTNSGGVPANATQAGDVWYFSVIPVSNSFLVGEEVFSPRVTITALPQVTQVSPAFGLVAGGEKVTITGTRLGTPIRILFGGAAAPNFRTLNDTTIEVTSPLHGAGTVDIVIETPTGNGLFRSGFTYVNSLDDIPLSDVNVDGRVDAVDVQLVVEAVLRLNGGKQAGRGDANGDGEINAADVQAVVNDALLR